MAKSIVFAWRRWLTWIMAAVLVVSLATWYFTRDTLPSTIRLATAVKGGMYHELGEYLQGLLEQRTGHEVQLTQTQGSKMNGELLRQRKIDVAIVQDGSVDMHELAVVTPLHNDVVVVVVRCDLWTDDPHEQTQISSVAELAGKCVIVGLPKSGMQSSADNILQHYDIADTVTRAEVHFTELLTDQDRKYDAAIVTTSLEAENLRAVLSTGNFRILPLDGPALERRFAHFRFSEIPTKLWPPVPAKPVPTVATSAMVVVRHDASRKLVSSVLDCLGDRDFHRRFPRVLWPADESKAMLARLHPAAERYHDPLYGFSWLTASLESIAAGRELLVAIGAGVFLIWERWRRLKERARQARISEQKARLNDFLERTLRIEKQQMNETDPKRLEKYLDDVTQIKLWALSELSHEELQDHRSFSIFLMQCANLISKIQLKIMLYTARDTST